MKTIYISILILFSIHSISAQSCYDKFIAEAQEQIKQLDFEKAISKFKAAKICPDITDAQINIIDQRIEDAREGFIATIKKANEKTQEALEIAKTQTRISEANRLAFYVNQAIEKNDYEEAFQVAMIAYDMVKDEPTILVEKAFGDAAYKYYHKEFSTNDTAILDIQVSDKQDKILILSRNQPACLYSSSGELLAKLSGHIGRTLSVLFSPYNNQIATSGEDGKILIWNEEGQQINSLSHSESIISSIQFSIEGKLLSVARDKSMKCWSSKGDLLHTTTFENRIAEAIFSPDGKSILCTTTAGAVKLISTDSGKTINEFLNFEGSIRQIIFTPNGSNIIIAPQNQPSSIWDNQGNHLVDLENNIESIPYAISCAPNSELITVASTTGLIEIYDLKGKLVNKYNREVDDFKILFDPSSSKIVFLQNDKSFVLWNWKENTTQLFDQHTTMITQLYFSNDGENILSSSNDNTAKLWTIDGRLVCDLDIENQVINIAKFDADNQNIMIGGNNGKVIISPTIAQVKKKMDKEELPVLSKAQKERMGL